MTEHFKKFIKLLKSLWSIICNKPDDTKLIRRLKRLIRTTIYSFAVLLLLFFTFRIYLEIFDNGILYYHYADITWGFYKNDCITIGNTIVEALERYKLDKGEYPESLEQLVPDYMSKIPKHKVGTKRWKYTSGGTNFVLLFSPNAKYDYPNCSYVSDLGNGEWFTDQ
jgi:hypothetical protein